MKMTSKMQNLKKSKKRINKFIKLTRYISIESYCIFLLSCFMGIYFLGGKSFSQEMSYSGIKSNVLFQEQSSAGNDTIKIKSPMGAAIRSILVPGLGQHYNGKKLKAVLAVAGEGTLIYLIFNDNKKFKDTNDISYRDRRNTLQWWFLFVLGVSAVDAYVDAYLDGFDNNMSISFDNSIQHPCLNLSIRF